MKKAHPKTSGGKRSNPMINYTFESIKAKGNGFNVGVFGTCGSAGRDTEQF